MTTKKTSSPTAVKIAYIGGGSRYWAKMVLTDPAIEPNRAPLPGSYFPRPSA